MVARFLECVVVSNWLPHTPVQIVFRLILVHKIVWCSFSSLNIQTGVLARTFHITRISLDPKQNNYFLVHWDFIRPKYSLYA